MKIIINLLILITFIKLSSMNVIELTDDNFHNIVKENDEVWFIKFFEFSCQHCQNFAETFIQLSESDLKDKIKFGEVECQFNTKTADEFDIRAFPTLRLFKFGKKTKNNILRYSEVDRTFEGLHKWLEEKYEWNLKNYNLQKEKEAKQKPKEVPKKAEIIKDKELYLLEESNFYDFLEESKLPVVVLFTQNSCYECEKLYDSIKFLAKQNLKHFIVATINSELFPAIAIKYHIVSYPTLKLFSEKYEGKDLDINATKLNNEIHQYIPKKNDDDL